MRYGSVTIEADGEVVGKTELFYSSVKFFIASKYFTIALALFFPNESQCHEVSGLEHHQVDPE